MKHLLSTAPLLFTPFLFCTCSADSPVTPTPETCTLEVCDFLDNDCDGLTDEGSNPDVSPAPGPWYRDADQDGWGDASIRCNSETASIGWTLQAGDCNETDRSIHPDAYEYCNDGIDRNCDNRPTRCGIYGEMKLADAGATIVGETEGHEFGNVARLPADFDQDGHSDLVVSASWETYTYDGGDIPQTVAGEGEFWFHPGPFFGAFTSSDLAEHIVGPYVEASLGNEIQAGDLTGDGYPDLILGSRGGQTGVRYDNQGIIYVFFGPLQPGLSLSQANARLLGDKEQDVFGTAIAAPVDSDDDGIVDLFTSTCCADIGEQYNLGAAYRFASPMLPGDALASTATLQISGDQTNAAFAFSCASSTDLSGDGIADLGVSAFWDSSRGCQAGSYYIFFGPKHGTLSAKDADAILYSREISDWFGMSASLSGDINGDGIHDALIGAHSSTSYCRPEEPTSDERGHVYLFLGPLKGEMDLSQADAVFEGEAAGDHAGSNVLSGADFDQDGFGDIVIGSSKLVEGNRRLGTIHVYYGPLSGWYSLANSDAHFLDLESTASLGPRDAGGDLNGDGYPDLVLSAYRANGNSQDPGAVYIFFGGPRT